MNPIRFLPLLLPLALPAALLAATRDGEAAIVQAVLASNERLLEAANRMDTDAMFAGIVNSDETRIIQNGRMFPTRVEAMASVRQGTQGVAKIERRFLNPHVSVLASDTALLTAEGTTAVTLKDGRTFSSRFAASLVFVLRGDRWLLLHGHYSQPNPAP